MPKMTRSRVALAAIAATLVLAVAGICMLQVGGAGTVAASAGTYSEDEWEPVRRGDFEILCREDGELRPIKVTTLTFMRWGRLSFMLPEGTAVKKGDRVLALDTKDIEDQLQRTQEDLTVQEKNLAEQDQNRALEIKRLSTELAAEKDRANLAHLKQKQVLDKPTDLDKRNSTNALAVAQAHLASAKLNLESIQPLAEKGYASKTDLATRETALARAEVELERAELKHQTTLAGATPLERERAALECEQADIQLALMELDSKNQIDILNSKADSARRDLEATKRRRDLVTDQLNRSVVLAQHNGIVVHRFINNKKVEVGDIVGPWASPVDLPNYERMKVRTQVPESFISRVATRCDTAKDKQHCGSHARMTIKTLPDISYDSEVVWVDGWSRDRNSKLSDADVKAQGLSGVRVFDVEVEVLKSDPQRLREGFRTDVEFPMETLKDVLSIPVQAVVSRDGCPQVKVLSAGTETWRKVVLGARSIDRVVILSGVTESDVVYVGKTQQKKAAPTPAKSSASL